jgi:uncharacterized protein (DUF58 family)
VRARPTLTPTGGVVAAAALALGGVGWALGYVALTAVAAGALAALGAGLVATLAVPRLDVARSIEPARVERGSPALGLVSVTNTSHRRSRACDAVDVTTAGDGRPPSAVLIEIPSLAARRTMAVPYRLPTERRGSMRVGPLAIERRDPLGLWHSRREVGDAVTLLVEPHVVPLDPRPVGRARHLDGPVSEQAPRGTQTFHSLREYVPGDDVRRVHWRSSARTGTLMVRDHVDTSLSSTVVVLDVRAHRYTGERFEDAVDVAASIVEASQRHGFPVRLVTSSGTVVVARAGQRGQALRDHLTTVEAVDGEQGGDLRRATIEVLRGREHDALSVVSGEVDGTDLAAVTAMARRFARPSLVTLRRDGGPRWSGGQHLDGPTAVAALRRWHAPARRAESPPAVTG